MISSNVLRVSTRRRFRLQEHRRYDIVLWVNGLPLVVGETKKPGAATSWLNAATDIHNGYEVKTSAFFVPNVLSFATDGRDFRYGAVRQPPELWLNWSKTTDEMMAPGLPAVMRSAELLLTPEMVLDVLRHFTLYSSRRTARGAVVERSFLAIRRSRRLMRSWTAVWILRSGRVGVASPGVWQDVCDGVCGCEVASYRRDGCPHDRGGVGPVGSD